MCKKLLSMLLILALLVSLFPAALAEEIAIVEPEEGIRIIDPAGEEPVPSGADDTVVGLIADGPVDGQDFNQLCYEAARDYCAAKGLSFKLFTTEDYDGAIVNEAVNEGCSVLIMAGFMFADMIRDCAPDNPSVRFIGLDVGAADLAGEDEGYEVPANVVLHTYKEEQAGFLAGYAAVKLGYTKLGFLGGMDFVPSVKRYGYGFVQGAEAAAAIEDDVTVFYSYSGQFFPEDWITAAMDVWIAQGIQAIFPCGGGIWLSAAEAAERGGAKIIAADMDMAPELGLCATSAIKNLPASIRFELDAILDGAFEGGQEKNLGVVSDEPEENFVGIGPSTQFGEAFTEDDYRALLAQIAGGELAISDDTEAEPRDFTVDARVVMKDLHAVPGEGLAVNEENFPDEIFREFVAFRLDPNVDWVLTDEELANITRFDCSNRGIESLEGVELFPNLAELDCSYNELLELDLTHNTKLESLACFGNRLQRLDVSECLALRELWCSYNELQELDVSMLPELEWLACPHNQITALDLSHNPKLYRFLCWGNEITSLDLSHNPELIFVNCQENPLSELNLTGLTKLQTLYAWECQLTDVDLSTLTALEYLAIGDNPMGTIDVTKNAALFGLYVENLGLTGLDLGGNPLLQELTCEGNRLTGLDLSKNPKLNYLTCYNNEIGVLDLSQCPELLAYLEEEPIRDPEGYPEGVVAYHVETIDGVDYYSLIVDGATTLLTGAEPSYPITGQCGDDLSWSLAEDGVLTVTGTGEMWVFGPGAFNPPWQEYKVEIVSLNMEGGASIGSFAFAGCEALEKIALPEGLETIGAMAFGGCSQLTEAVIPASVTEIQAAAFNGCEKLESLKLPATLTHIAYAAFLGCSTLPEVEIPASVKKIDGAVFAECGSLSKVTFTGDAPEMDNNTFLYVTATAYYPANNETWTEAVMQDYGGHLTWVESGPQPIITPMISLDGMSTQGIGVGWAAFDGMVDTELQRRSTGGWEMVKTGFVLGYADEKVQMGQTYYYRLRITNGTEWSDWSEVLEVFFNPFADVSGKKTIEYVAWAFNNGIVNGTSTTTFTPDDPCTRVQFVMMLWKMHGSPVVGGKNPFSDISGKKTTNAILWALDAGVINSGKTFNPNDNISRVQIVMILWKLAGSPTVTGDNPFKDVSGKKTTQAVLWAYQNGITKGTSATTFAPDADCTRVQLVVFLYKYNGIYPVI